MRVLLVSRELAPFFGGGIGTYTATMAAVLADAGHEVEILTGDHAGLRSAPPPHPRVRVHSVNLSAGRAGLDAYPTYALKYAMAVLDAAERLTAERSFDYVEFPDYHAEGYFALRARRTGAAVGGFADAVLGVRLHSASWVCNQADGDARVTLERAFLEHLERRVVAEADLVVAPGRRTLERVNDGRDAVLSLDHRPAETIIPIPVDLDRVVRDLGGGEDPTPSEPEVLFFGKLQYLKGPQDLVAAALQLLDRGVRARFRFIGNDSPTGPFGRSMLDYLRSRIPANRRDVFTFEPARPRHRLGAAIRAAARSGGVCCFPSRWEAFPMVCLEAMCLGAPVVAADAGGLGEIVEDGVSGVLFPAADLDALAGALERTLRDTGLRHALAAAAPERVRRLCDPARVVRLLEDAVAAARPTASPAMPSRAAASSPAAATPAVTIVIPYYNMGRYLPETLASVRAQTRRDFETIVVDDGSTDPESLSLLERLGSDVRIVRKPNGGLSSARNAGIREARTPWVLPLDADDLIAPTLLERVLAVAERYPELDVISPLVSYFIDDPARPTGGWVPLGLDRDLLLLKNVGAAASGTLIRRDAALAVGGYDEWMTSYEDWEFWCRMAGARRRAVVVPEFLLHYRVRRDSMFRTEATARHAALHAYIIARHATLPRDASRVLRVLQDLADFDPHASAMSIIRENIRYRVVDGINDALKAAGMQRALKGLTVRVLRAGRRSRG